jgi:hypothetical protein
MVIALMFSHVPAINSLHSVYMCMERPLVYAELAKAVKQLEGLTLVPMNFHANEMIASTNPSITPAEHRCAFQLQLNV